MPEFRPFGNKSLQRGRPYAGSFFQLRLVLQTVWRPRHRLETLCVDRFAVDDALPICAVVDPLQRGPHLSEDRRVGIGQGEIFFFELVDLGEIAGVTGVGAGVASGLDFLAETLDQFSLERQQSPSVMVDIHGVSASRGAFPVDVILVPRDLDR
jgi:hypothetical protein